ncbi:retroviral-like aspartic protease family protein [Dyella telluris]|uniref:Retroviral-like aspartic protease family protein n=2 Tax=Dyella telluris TaxID=2763498 RepID=A0A7G8QAS1_9GAMM|nr:retroviral-like aspartic protease family protein [Dyella telluris]
MGLLFATHVWAGECHLESYGTLPVEMVGNQATTMVKINGQSTRFILDTGAFFNIMSAANAAALGLRLQPAPFGYRVSGIGGSANIQQAHVKEFGILDTTLKNVDFIVGGSDAGNGLLGANLLDIADLEIDLAHGKLTLFKAEHCDNTSLAYWVKDDKYNLADIERSPNRFDRRTFVNVTINGRKVRALIDSGAAATVLFREAAERIGIDVSARDVKSGFTSFGVGGRPVHSWTVNIDSFSVGSETIQHSQMQVLDGSTNDGTDMLLGVDFLLAHHMFIATSKGKVYFTYNGGRVFTYAQAPGDDGKAMTDTNAASPKSAADAAMLGQAHLSRGEAHAAVADLDEAIRMAPGQADYYVIRARAFQADMQPEAAAADLDTALSLQPRQVDALLMRARLRLAHKDRAGAASDAATASAAVTAGSTQARAVASLYIQLDQPASALPLLDDWIRLHGDDAMLGAALNERCWARALSNQMLDDALKDCRKAIRRDGQNPAYLDSLGLVQLRLGQYPDAIKAYRQSLAEKPDTAWSRYGLGLAEIRAGQADAGQADLVAARALDPHIETQAAGFGLTASGP